MNNLNETTFTKEIKSNPKDRISVIVGDDKQSDFKPQFKVQRWDNEANFSIRAEEKVGATLEVEGEIIKYITPEYEVHQYDKPEIGEDGGFEFEWVLKQKPTSNVLMATIQSKELEFLYQPPLTQKQIDKGFSRPENVVGSYAVYHSTKGRLNDSTGMEYKSGKAFHIFRPKAIDSKNQEVWCDLHIDPESGILTVAVPQDFLDNAMYPIKVDPTFGYTGHGASTAGFSANQMWAKGGTPVSGGTVTDVTVYATAGGAVNFRGLIIAQSNKVILSNGVGRTAVMSGTTAEYTSSYISSPTVVGGVDYWAGVVFDLAMTIYWDAGSGSDLFDSTNSYATPTDPTDGAVSTDRPSIYATYTASGSPSSSISPSPSASQSPSSSVSSSISSSVSASQSPSSSPSSSVSSSVSASQSPSSSVSLSPSSSVSLSASSSPSSSQSPSSSVSLSISLSISLSPSSSQSPSNSVSASPSPSPANTGWQARPLYFWNGSSWQLVDTSG